MLRQATVHTDYRTTFSSILPELPCHFTTTPTATTAAATTTTTITTTTITITANENNFC